VAQLSGGQRKRVSIAVELITKPSIIFLDEPTSGLDPQATLELLEIIRNLKNHDVSVLLSSHLLSQVQEICDRVGILAKGSLVREGRLEDLIAVENRSELVLEDASESLLKEIEKLAASSNAKFVERRRSTTTLERLFLDATSKDK
jgi:ABC-2 type transport system ATP-binding protein